MAASKKSKKKSPGPVATAFAAAGKGVENVLTSAFFLIAGIALIGLSIWIVGDMMAKDIQFFIVTSPGLMGYAEAIGGLVGCLAMVAIPFFLGLEGIRRAYRTWWPAEETAH